MVDNNNKHSKVNTNIKECDNSDKSKTINSLVDKENIDNSVSSENKHPFVMKMKTIYTWLVIAW